MDSKGSESQEDELVADYLAAPTTYRETQTIDTPGGRLEEAKADKAEKDNYFRVVLFWVLLVLLVLTVVSVNVSFYLYMCMGVHWDAPPASLNVWIIGGIAQIYGLMSIIVSYLFHIDGLEDRTSWVSKMAGLFGFRS